MNKRSKVYVPDGDYDLHGVKVNVCDNGIYLMSTHKILYGTIDSSMEKDNEWHVGFIRQGKIKKGEVKMKREAGLLKVYNQKK